MERIKMPKALHSNITYHSDYCDKHKKPIQKMIVSGNIVCPTCQLEEENAKLTGEVNEYFKQLEKDKLYNFLLDNSIVEDETLLKARLHNFLTHDLEETENKHKAQDALKRYLNGETFNLILQGYPGTGKSHLSYSVLHELNEARKGTCLFISIEAMLRKIKASFNDKSKYTEEYFNLMLSNVDYLVLDDLGAETGAIETNKTATDFVHRVLYGIATSRQNKSTIVTTNLSSKVLFSMYDRKLISRLFKSPTYIVFEKTTDKRMQSLF